MINSILIHPADSGGCYHYRLGMPARALIFGKKAEQVAEAPFYLPDDDFEGQDGTKYKGLLTLKPDLIMIQRQFSDGQPEFVEKYLKAGFTVGHDLDDYLWKVPASNPFINAFGPKGRKNLARVLRAVNFCTVSTEPLRDAIQNELGIESRVVPNFVSVQHFRQPRRRDYSRKLKVGWAGSPTHTGDLAPLFSVIRQTQDIFEWHFLGWHPEGLGDSVIFHPPAKVQDYMNALYGMDLDVAIAPLEDNLFNECKSHLKLLEFSALGMPVICSDVYPYKESPTPLVKPSNTQWKTWREILDSYDEDEELRLRDAWAHYSWAYRYVLENSYNIDIIERGWTP